MKSEAQYQHEISEDQKRQDLEDRYSSTITDEMARTWPANDLLNFAAERNGGDTGRWIGILECMVIYLCTERDRSKS